MGSYKEQGREERRQYTEAILEQLQKSEKVKRKIRKEKKELRKRTVRKIREQGSKSCELFWTDLRGKRKAKVG